MKRTWLAAAAHRQGGLDRRRVRLRRLAVSVAGRPSPVRPPEAAAPSESSVQLPIGRVVLFSSGVGYFAAAKARSTAMHAWTCRCSDARHQRSHQKHGAAATWTAATSRPFPTIPMRFVEKTLAEFRRQPYRPTRPSPKY